MKAGIGTRGLRTALLCLGVFLAATPSTSAAGSTVFGGSTSDDDIIVITADNRAEQVKKFVIAFEASCSDGRRYAFAWPLKAAEPKSGTEPSLNRLPMTLNKDGRFSGTQVTERRLSGGPSLTLDLRVSGRLTERAASGTLRAVVKVLDEAGAPVAECRTGRIRFTATRRPRSVYAGETTQGHPVVARVNAKRTRVSSLRVSWRAGCRPSGVIRIPDELYSLRIRRGRFNDRQNFTYKLDNGAERRFRVKFSGRVRRSTVTGTLRVRISTTASADQPARECDTGKVAWKARTG